MYPGDGVVPFLKDIGVIPADVVYVKPVNVKLDLDPETIEAGYLAASAYEWDSWGASHAEDFIDALSKETKGSETRDIIAGLMTLLGREAILDREASLAA